MDPTATETFVVRIWSEAREPPGEPTLYRARVEHVGSGRVRYVRNLDDVGAFVRSCLWESDLPPGAFDDHPPHGQ